MKRIITIFLLIFNTTSAEAIKPLANNSIDKKDPGYKS